MTALISMSIRQAADATGLSESSIREAIDKKKLPAKKYGTKKLVKFTDLEKFIDSLENASE